MTDGELTALLTEQFYDDFAGMVAERVREADAVGVLYGLVTLSGGLPRNVRHKVLFRGAYVLEKICLESPDLFAPYAESFFADFPDCTDASARRHFGKMMAHLLRDRTPAPDVLDRIADSAAQWAIDPAAKVAVRIWAVEVLKCCRGKLAWVDDAWDDLMVALEQDATPGIACRLCKSWKIGGLSKRQTLV